MLSQGSNIVNLPMNLISKKGCGFFPVSERVERIQTQGLKWNMGNEEDYVKSIDWKTQISSSNEIVSDTLEVNVSHDVLFVASIN